MTERIKVKNATSKGYSWIGSGGVLNIAFPESKTRRGRVIDGGNISPTLDTGCNIGVIQIETERDNEKPKSGEQDL